MRRTLTPFGLLLLMLLAALAGGLGGLCSSCVTVQTRQMQCTVTADDGDTTTLSCTDPGAQEARTDGRGSFAVDIPIPPPPSSDGGARAN